MTKSIDVLSGNSLKIIALIAMTLDHIGYLLLPQYPILRIIGRISFPIFSYMIAEGCRYTKNRTRYLLTIFGFGLVFQVVYYVADKSLLQGVFISFSLGILLIFSIENFLKRRTFCSITEAAFVIGFVVFVCIVLPNILSYTNFKIDYGIFGVLLPVIVYFMPDKFSKLIGLTVAIIGMSFVMGGRQWYALIAVLILALYNGERGKLKIKNFFYLYYPLHLVVIYCLKILWR